MIAPLWNVVRSCLKRSLLIKLPTYYDIYGCTFLGIRFTKYFTINKNISLESLFIITYNLNMEKVWKFCDLSLDHFQPTHHHHHFHHPVDFTKMTFILSSQLPKATQIMKGEQIKTSSI